MATLRFAAFGQDDNRLAGPEIGQVFLTTRDGTPCSPPLVGDDQGLSIDTSQLTCSPGEGFVLHVRWVMPEFGYLWLQADNGGGLYRVPRAGSAQVWNLNYELARTRVLWNSQLEQTGLQQRMAGLPPQGIGELLAKAASLLHDAMFANHDRRSRLADDALARALDAGERLAVHVARSRIGQQVRHKELGPPAALRLATTVIPQAVPAAESWRAVFDEAVVRLTADEVLGGGEAAGLEPVLEFAAQAGARLRGRALLPYVDASGQPAAARTDGERAEWREAAVRLVRRWGDRIATWELLPPVAGMAVSAAHVDQVVETANAVKSARPESELVLCPGEMFAPRMTAGAARTGGAVRVARKCLQATSAIDALGVALYYPGCDLLQLLRTIDLLAGAGRPVHLLMAAAPSRWEDDPRADLGRGREDFTRRLGYWRQPWSPEVQAEYGLGLVMMARAHPAVVAVEWSDFSDAGPHAFPHGGLLDERGEPKPLHGLLAEARQQEYALDRPWAHDLSGERA